MDFSKIRQILLPLSLAFITTLIFQYFFFVPQETSKDLESGRSRVAPKMAEINRPLNLEIDFYDKKLDYEEKINVIQTDHAKYEFTNFGAAIKSAEFKHLNNTEHVFKTFKAQGKEDLSFLIAFDESSPFYYKLVQENETNDAFELIYEAIINEGTLGKKFIIFKHQYKIDLTIDVKLKQSKEPLRLRIFYPSPSIADVKDDIIQGVYNEQQSVLKKPMNVLLQKYWEIPSLFGIEDKYFVNAMINDQNGLIQRGYYKTIGNNQFSSIIESGEIKQSGLYTLSFYMGPKQAVAMAPVDSRLEAVLDYGYFAPFAKLLLLVLIFFYGYVKSYGIAIILLTILIKLILIPFTLKGEQSMKSRAELQKKLQYLQQKYKDDKETLMRARTELLKEQGMPDLIGCLPLLLQLPIFIALNRVLSNAIELYQAPFLWMSDLSVKDPYYILPILVGVSMILHSSSASNDPRQRFSAYGIALVVAAFTAGFPAGLVLFIFVSTILSVLQTRIYNMFKRS